MVPSETDIDVVVEVEPKILELLQCERPYDFRIHLREVTAAQISFLRPAVAEITLPAQPVVRTTMRIPWRAVVQASLFAHYGGDGKYFLGERILSLTRDDVPRLEFSIGLSNIMIGKVVDHLGRALAGAQVDILKARPDLPGGFSRYPLVADAAGGFLYFDEPRRVRIRASYYGAESVIDGVSMGQVDVRVVLSLIDHKRVLIHRGGRPIEHFRVGPDPFLFCSTKLPQLPVHEGGVGWLPWKQGAEPSSFMLAWQEAEEYYEYEVRRPDPAADGRLVIDLNTVGNQPCGVIEVSFGASVKRIVQIERILPKPGAGGCRMWRLVGPGQTDPVRLHGIPAGSYRIQTRSAQEWPGTPPIRQVETTFFGGSYRWDVSTPK